MKTSTKSVQSHNPVGRPPSFTSPEDLQTKINDYLAWAEKNKKPLTLSRLACFVGCDRRTIYNYYHKPDKSEFFPIIKTVVDKIEADITERLVSGKQNVAGLIFYLKNNHEWKDSSHVELDGKLEGANVYNIINAIHQDVRKNGVAPLVVDRGAGLDKG